MWFIYRIADADPGPGQMMLEPANVLGRGCIGRTPEEGREPPATADVAALRTRRKLARLHVLDHALTQRGDYTRTHGELLPG